MKDYNEYKPVLRLGNVQIYKQVTYSSSLSLLVLILDNEYTAQLTSLVIHEEVETFVSCGAYHHTFTER